MERFAATAGRTCHFTYRQKGGKSETGENGCHPVPWDTPRPACRGSISLQPPIDGDIFPIQFDLSLFKA
jgi:hypothetical protein